MTRRCRGRFIFAFLAPAATLYALFLLYPLAQAFVMSFYKWSGLSDRKEFIGFDNFRALLSDDGFRQALANNAWMLCVSFCVLMSAGLAIAHLLQHGDRFTGMVRAVFLFPHVMSLIAAALLWYFVYSPTSGLLNGITGLWGATPQAWLGQKTTALPAVTVAFIWWALGFYVMLFSAGLRMISDEIYEAASLDGSTGWHRFRFVTWPMLFEVKRIAAIYVVINVVNTFGLINLMTNGGNPDRATEVLLTYLYERGIEGSRFGYGTAIAVVTFLCVVALSVLVMAWFRRDPAEARSA